MLIYSEQQHDANPAHCACDSKTVRAAETVCKLFRSVKRARFAYIYGILPNKENSCECVCD